MASLKNRRKYLKEKIKKAEEELNKLPEGSVKMEYQQSKIQELKRELDMLSHAK